MTFKIIQGDNRDVLKTIADNSIDAIVTDPPYGIDFLGKDWDANTGALETYQECLRVLKPGGHILAFSAARTYHHLAITLEQAGFEIRDQLMWIYSSGFPKSLDIGKSIERHGKKDGSDWYGWGTALKPAPYPYLLPELCIKLTSQPGDLIYDPFAGSGSTLYAGLKNDRSVVGTELNKDFVVMAQQRLDSLDNDKNLHNQLFLDETQPSTTKDSQ